MARVARALSAALAMVLFTSACAGGGSDESTIRFALDWTPNTNHTGLYVAIENGYFEDAGLEVEILPYNDTLPDQLIDAGNAEFGISFHDSTTMAQTTGADVISVMAPLQHWATAVGVRDDDDSITGPADLDGLTYAGFGAPYEEPVLREVIRNDGGTGKFTTVTLGTSAYEALYGGDADFTIPFFAWEGIEAERRGTPMKYFQYTDFGFPDAYAVVVDANRSWLDDNPEAARAFVQALQRGYEFAIENPREAAQILIDANPGAFSDEELVVESQQMLSADYMRAADGTVGTFTLEQWAGYGTFLFDKGILADADGEPLTIEPDWTQFFTNDYLRQD
ncbi:MAG: ABC transporter substrate-binding protein [Nocardioides sp.]|nr:ABC transporter substrate-binding protein [Nocardioides sp.]